MAFDPQNCFIVPPLPGPMLNDGAVPDPPDPLPDCLSLDPPPLPPEPLCPTFVSTGGSLRQVHAPSGPPFVDLNLSRDPGSCDFQLDPVITIPCVNLSTFGFIEFLPPGSEPTVSFAAEPVSQGPTDPCGWMLSLALGLPGQICPSFSGTGEVAVVPPDDPDAGTVIVTTTNDSQSQDGCDIAFHAVINVPCMQIDVGGGDVTINQIPVDQPPAGEITVEVSGEPCAPIFTLNLDLDLPFPTPHVEPVLTDLCIDENGSVHAAEVSYIQWPDADVKYKVWRSQFGYCDENRCYYEPAQFLLWNTGVDENGDPVSDACVADLHWFHGEYPTMEDAMVMDPAEYPAPWMPAGRRSKWISHSCEGNEANDVSHFFWTVFSVPAEVDAAELALEFQLLQDNYILEVLVNGEPTVIEGLTDVYPNPNRCDLPGPMCRFLIRPGNFLAGTNVIQFEVYNTFADEEVNWEGMRLEWIGIGACGTTTTTTTAEPTSTTTTTGTTSEPGEGNGICCVQGVHYIANLHPPMPTQLLITVQLKTPPAPAPGCPLAYSFIATRFGSSGGTAGYSGVSTKEGPCGCWAGMPVFGLTCAFKPSIGAWVFRADVIFGLDANRDTLNEVVWRSVLGPDAPFGQDWDEGSECELVDGRYEFRLFKANVELTRGSSLASPSCQPTPLTIYADVEIASIP